MGKINRVLILDLAFVVGTLVVLGILYSSYGSVALSPDEDGLIRPTEILFEFSSGKVIIGESLDFDSPREIDVVGGGRFSLEEGLYYFKIPLSESYSDVRKMELEVKVDFEFVNLGEGRFGLINAGNRIDVDVLDGQGFLLENVRFAGGQDE